MKRYGKTEGKGRLRSEQMVRNRVKGQTGLSEAETKGNT